MTEYTVSTSNSQNKITAIAADETASVVITVGGSKVQNESNASWEVGENTLKVTVADGALRKIYTVIVTKS